MVNGRKSPCACDVGAEFRSHVAYSQMHHRHQNVGREHNVSTVDYTQDIWARADERAYGPQPKQPKQRVPVRECVWACDCKVGNGNRDALVHAIGCASQVSAREAVLVETYDGA